MKNEYKIFFKDLEKSDIEESEINYFTTKDNPVAEVKSNKGKKLATGSVKSIHQFYYFNFFILHIIPFKGFYYHALTLHL